MPQFTVWVAHGEGGERVEITTTADGEGASRLAGALVAVAGSKQLEIGIDVMPGDQQSPTPPPPPPGPQQPPPDGGQPPAPSSVGSPQQRGRR